MEPLDCPFEVPAGTYVSTHVEYDPELQVLIDDPVAGFWTDGSGVVLEEPAGGAVASPMQSHVSEGGGELPEPFVIDGGPVELKVVLLGVHTVSVAVDGSGAHFATGFGVQLYPTPSALATAALCTSGEAEGAYDPAIRGMACEMFLFYEDPTTPSCTFLVAGLSRDHTHGRDSDGPGLPLGPGSRTAYPRSSAPPRVSEPRKVRPFPWNHFGCAQVFQRREGASLGGGHADTTVRSSIEVGGDDGQGRGRADRETEPEAPRHLLHQEPRDGPEDEPRTQDAASEDQPGR